MLSLRRTVFVVRPTFLLPQTWYSIPRLRWYQKNTALRDALFSAIPENDRDKPAEWESQRGGIVENVKVPVNAVSACVRLFIELLLDGRSRADANDAAGVDPARPHNGSPLATN